MIKYLPFIIQALTVLVVVLLSKKVKDKVAKRLFLATFILPQIVVFLGYLKVFVFMYRN